MSYSPAYVKRCFAWLCTWLAFYHRLCSKFRHRTLTIMITLRDFLIITNVYGFTLPLVI